MSQKVNHSRSQNEKDDMENNFPEIIIYGNEIKQKKSGTKLRTASVGFWLRIRLSKCLGL